MKTAAAAMKTAAAAMKTAAAAMEATATAMAAPRSATAVSTADFGDQRVRGDFRDRRCGGTDW
jgi:hypothetical protein